MPCLQRRTKMNCKGAFKHFCIQFVQLVYQKDADKAWTISVTGGDDNYLTGAPCCTNRALLTWSCSSTEITSFFKMTATFHYQIRRPPVGRVLGLAQQGETLCLCIPVSGCVSAGVRSTALGQTEDPETPRRRTCSKDRRSA